MTYFNPFAGTDARYEAAGELARLGSDLRVDCDVEPPSARGMNDIIVCLAMQHGAAVANVNRCSLGSGSNSRIIGASDIHANNRGYEVIADAFLEALSRELVGP
jgi:hypothetical protein